RHGGRHRGRDGLAWRGAGRDERGGRDPLFLEGRRAAPLSGSRAAQTGSDRQVQPDLPELLAGLEPAQRLVDAVDAELAVDHRYDAAPLDETQQVLELRQIAEGRAENLKLPDEKAPNVCRGLVAGRRA